MSVFYINLKYFPILRFSLSLLLIVFLFMLSVPAFSSDDKPQDCDLLGNKDLKCKCQINEMVNNKRLCCSKESPLAKRICEEKSLRTRPYVLVPHKPTYILFSYVDGLEKENDEFSNIETKFQISFKVPLNAHDAGAKWLGFFGYTQLSTWQMTNIKQSSPFRDTNFEPELMVYYFADTNLLGWDMKLINIGIWNHQSNGKTPPDSRSWNRSYIDFLFERDKHYVSFKRWWRWEEKDKTDPADFRGDDNPFIEDYVGNGELKYLYVEDKFNFGASFRDNKQADSRVSVQIDLSWRIKSNLGFIKPKSGMRFYVQYFNGYGETLIDYNIKRERIGLGLMLSDWL